MSPWDLQPVTEHGKYWIVCALVSDYTITTSEAIANTVSSELGMSILFTWRDMFLSTHYFNLFFYFCLIREIIVKFAV